MIFEETFSGAGALDGKRADEAGGLPGPVRWDASPVFQADGSVNEGAEQTGAGSALIPFLPEPGKIYRLTATFSLKVPHGARGIGFGFNRDGMTGSDFGDLAENAGFAWVLLREPGPASPGRFYLGAGGFGGEALDVDPFQPQSFTIILDATDPDPLRWTAALERKGRLVCQPRVISEAGIGNPAKIRYFGLVKMEGFVSGHFDRVSLVEESP